MAMAAPPETGPDSRFPRDAPVETAAYDPVVSAYENMSDGELEDLARDRAGLRNARLKVESQGDEWLAAFVQDHRVIGEVILMSAETDTHRRSLIGLLENDDLERAT